MVAAVVVVRYIIVEVMVALVQFVSFGPDQHVHFHQLALAILN
jgi:hypothetical protein